MKNSRGNEVNFLPPVRIPFRGGFHPFWVRVTMNEWEDRNFERNESGLKQNDLNGQTSTRTLRQSRYYASLIPLTEEEGRPGRH